MKPRSIQVWLFCLTIAAGIGDVERGWGQTSPQPMALGRVVPLSVEERQSVESAALADSRIRQIVSAAQPRVVTTGVEVDKAEAEAFLAGTSTTPPTRRATIVVFNAQTNQAARILVSLEGTRVLSVSKIAASDVPLSRDDTDHALALAKGNPDVRRAVGSDLDQFVILEPGSEANVPFAAQALPLRSTNPDDVCSRNRCLDLIFRTTEGYLPVRAHIDLTKQVVTVQSGGGHHP